jgi:hypothetical protein
MTGVATGLAGLAGSVQVAVMGRFGGRIGVDQIGLSWPRLVGIVLLGAGAALSLAK